MQRDKIIELRARMALIKPQLMAIRGWKGQFIEKYPEYDNLYGLGLLNNIIAGRSTDKVIIEHLEAMVAQNTPKVPQFSSAVRDESTK